MIMIIVSALTVLICLFTGFAVLFRGNKKLSNISFFISLFSTAAVVSGDSLSILMPDYLYEWKQFVFISETVMATSWFLFTLSFARTNKLRDIGLFQKVFLLMAPVGIFSFIAVPPESFFYSPDFQSEGILFLERPGYILNIILLLYSVISIINLEATLRNASGVKRWQIKYMILGVGGILAINIFYYSQALLYRSINMNLLPVKTGFFLVSMMFIGFSLVKCKVMDVELAVSRKVFYRSLSIIAVGIYLLGLGLMGEGMRYFGPQVGKNITAFLGFAGAILILTVILSEQLRRKFMVLVNKHFYKHKYDYREQWLRFTQLISHKYSLDELLISITEGFKEAIGVKGASIWLNEKGEYVCVKTVDTEMVQIRPRSEMLDFFRNSRWVLDVHDDKCADVVSENWEFIEKTFASLIVPLFRENDDILGLIVLSEGIADNEYNYEDYDLLKTLARQASAAILNAKLSEELAKSKEMEAMGRVAAFITHDLKNAASMLSLIVQNAEEHMDSPEFRKDAVRAVANTTEKIGSIINKLRNLPEKINLSLEFSDLGMCVKTAVAEISSNGGAGIHYEEKSAVSTKFDREEIKKVIVNLLLNAIDATDNRGEIQISVGVENGMACIKVVDNGCGISNEYIREKLFRPFYSTKRKGLGIGLYQCKTIVESHAGNLNVKSTQGKGTEFTVFLPLLSD